MNTFLLIELFRKEFHKELERKIGLSVWGKNEIKLAFEQALVTATLKLDEQKKETTCLS